MVRLRHNDSSNTPTNNHGWYGRYNHGGVVVGVVICKGGGDDVNGEITREGMAMVAAWVDRSIDKAKRTLMGDSARLVLLVMVAKLHHTKTPPTQK